MLYCNPHNESVAKYDYSKEQKMPTKNVTMSALLH